MTKHRIVIADDHPIVLAGLRMLIEGAGEFELVAEAKTGPQALQAILAAKPDVAILDISLPQMNGIAVARRMAKECPTVGAIALTSHEDRTHLNEALDAGMRGYVLKRSTEAYLLKAIRGVLVGGLCIDPAIAGEMFPALRPKQRGQSEASPLTKRESEVLKLVARGLTNKEVASRLDVSVKSVETYRARGSAKIGAKTRHEIVCYAALRGWLTDV